jgi:negative regulator of sigma E activity
MSHLAYASKPHQTDGGHDYIALISAGFDGELDDQELLTMLDRHQSDINASCWQTWQLIGDTLRQSPSTHPSQLAQRVAEQLKHEPTILAPKPLRAMHTRHMMSLAASVSVVALVSWSALHLALISSHTTQLASSAPASSHAIQIAQIDPARLASFVAAHRDFALSADSPDTDTSTQNTAEPTQ